MRSNLGLCGVTDLIEDRFTSMAFVFQIPINLPVQQTISGSAQAGRLTGTLQQQGGFEVPYLRGDRWSQIL